MKTRTIISVPILLVLLFAIIIPAQAQPLSNPSSGGIGGIFLLLILLGAIYVIGICAIAIFYRLRSKIMKWVSSWQDC
ncbi:MAG: hypothetical protein ABSD13_02770 [Candidatus Korobacteraceae bacterium]|jgi:hypothetical protein